MCSNIIPVISFYFYFIYILFIYLHLFIYLFIYVAFSLSALVSQASSWCWRMTTILLFPSSILSPTRYSLAEPQATKHTHIFHRQGHLLSFRNDLVEAWALETCTVIGSRSVGEKFVLLYFLVLLQCCYSFITRRITAYNIYPDSKYLFVGTEEGTVRVINVDTYQVSAYKITSNKVRNGVPFWLFTLTRAFAIMLTPSQQISVSRAVLLWNLLL